MMNFNLPIAKGIISEFDKTLTNIHKLSLINPEHHTDEKFFTDEYEEAFLLYDKINENLTEEDCFKMIECLKDLPKEECIDRCDKDAGLGGFYHNLKKFRDLVEEKIALPFQQWKEIKNDLMHFTETYDKLQEESGDIRQRLENGKFLRNKEISEQEVTTEHEKKMDLTSQDFKSLHPYFIMANLEEHIERISALKGKKLQVLQYELKSAQQNFQQAIKTNKNEIQTIAQESIQTKSFIEWLEEKNYIKLKELEVKVKKEWNEYSIEMKNSRNLGDAYSEKNALYLDIKRQEDYEERLRKQDAAAIFIQAHWRGHLTRKRLRGDTLF